MSKAYKETSELSKPFNQNKGDKETGSLKMLPFLLTFMESWWEPLKGPLCFSSISRASNRKQASTVYVDKAQCDAIYE
jgi:hypothetical protein